ncbi:MAG TPA: hypothetical protein VEJ19_05475 [Nitrososphaerales archaeon]|nr:hypothetical protein [Nitrososphaerales archaeon]
MRIDEAVIRYAVETIFAAGAVTLMVYLWFIDQVANQRAFGAIVGSELVIFAMMIQMYRSPSVSGRNNTWLLLGCAVAAFFLLLAVQLSVP